MSEYITGRLQTPADDEGKRKDIHLITSADCVLMNDGSTLDENGKGETLLEKIGQLSIQVNTGKPEYPCIWAKELRSEPIVETVSE